MAPPVKEDTATPRVTLSAQHPEEPAQYKLTINFDAKTIENYLH